MGPMTVYFVIGLIFSMAVIVACEVYHSDVFDWFKDHRGIGYPALVLIIVLFWLPLLCLAYWEDRTK